MEASRLFQLQSRSENYSLEQLGQLHMLFLFPHPKEFEGLSRKDQINKKERRYGMNSYAKMLSEYMLSDDKEPRVMYGRPGVGKTMTYIEALMETIPQEKDMMPSAVLYRNSSSISILDHMNLASESFWGENRMDVIMKHRGSDGYDVVGMIKDSNVVVYDDMGYLIKDVVDRKYPIKKFNDHLYGIISDIESGKKVIMITDDRLGLYAEDLERSGAFELSEIKRLNDALPKLGDVNPLHRGEYAEINYMADMEIMPEAVFVPRMRRYIHNIGIEVEDISFVDEEDKTWVRERILGVDFLFYCLGTPRNFIEYASSLISDASKKRDKIIRSSDMLGLLSSKGRLPETFHGYIPLW